MCWQTDLSAAGRADLTGGGYVVSDVGGGGGVHGRRQVLCGAINALPPAPALRLPPDGRGDDPDAAAGGGM